MRRRGFTLVEGLVVVAIIIVLALILFPVFNRSGGSGHRPSCLSHLRQSGLGIVQYSQDYDEKLPLVRVHKVSSSAAWPYPTPYGWADAVQGYIKNTQIYQCPSEETSTNPGTDGVQPGFTDYWFNTNLSGVNLKKVIHPATTLLLGDGNDGADLTDGRYNRNSLPLSWLQNSGSPARRHLDTANYAFADGHVKSYKPEHIKNTRAKASDLSFALR